MPNNFSTGGVTGISVVLSGFFKLQSASIIASALNILMLILGFSFGKAMRFENSTWLNLDVCHLVTARIFYPNEAAIN